jgi:hypothetical protein
VSIPEDLDMAPQLAEAIGRHIAESAELAWPVCPEGCGCRLGTDNADARECGCDGPCNSTRPLRSRDD